MSTAWFNPGKTQHVVFHGSKYGSAEPSVHTLISAAHSSAALLKPHQELSTPTCNGCFPIAVEGALVHSFLIRLSGNFRRKPHCQQQRTKHHKKPDAHKISIHNQPPQINLPFN